MKILILIFSFFISSTVFTEEKNEVILKESERQHYSEVFLRDIDFDGEDEWITLHNARGNRHYKEYKAFNIENNQPTDLVFIFREDAIFDSTTKTVVNHWSSNWCTHETETYVAKDKTLMLIKSVYSDFDDTNLYGCIRRTFEGEPGDDLRVVKTECTSVPSDDEFYECDLTNRESDSDEIMLEYDENGEPFTGTRTIHYPEYRYTGTGRGKVARVIEYSDGKQHGDEFWFHPTGDSWERYSFKDGKRDGLFESFSYGDIPIRIYCFKDDIRVDMSYCSTNGGDR
ncbi:hypothetical protein OAK29_03290 [Gammaproteobacteria bacterium]|nr:hypothetical protein [Gammaproteobacteria bacterium]